MDNKLTDNEIIKAFECCNNDGCENCPNRPTCCEIDVADEILNIINRQKAEIDRLRYILVNFMGEIFDWGNKNGVDTRIFAQTAILGKEKDGAVKQIKSEAYREFAERFKYFVLHEDIEIVDCKCTDYQNYVNGANQFRHQVKNGIDTTLKELTESKNDFKE